jgi:hypothetical protein
LRNLKVKKEGRKEGTKKIKKEGRKERREGGREDLC